MVLDRPEPGPDFGIPSAGLRSSPRQLACSSTTGTYGHRLTRTNVYRTPTRSSLDLPTPRRTSDIPHSR
ncbi:hypothetical protein CALCODRAFT_501825 [Calocera cornea HHB12733]|uniref:Uncharacterized protein n=1 Tax=Calocera cornea HHB12733 TaxID=1353952 RepID=A0A165DHV3_9BASI|nr:hypothetical protein CALCODRAFT_501825 [Calocera cornea HHB12733]